MAAVFSAYLQAGFYGSVIIGVIVLLRLLLRKAPRQILCILWLLAAVRLLVPVNFESALSLQPELPKEQIIIEFVEREDATAAPPASELPEETLPQLSPMPQPELTPAVNPVERLSILWAAGVGVAVLYCLVSFLVLKCKVAEAVKKNDGVRESGRVNAPFLLGYLKPVIYVPVSLQGKDREFVIAHERAHILRGDNWWKLLGFISACVHWYNPVVWLGYALLCRDIEIACDEQVVAKMDLQTRKAYSLALLNCGKRMSGLLTCPVAFGEVSLRQRIKNVLSYRRPGMWITAAAVLTVVLVGVCFLTSPAESAPWSQQLQEAPAAPETEAALPTEDDPPVTEAAGSRPEATTAASESTGEPETAATAPTEASTIPTEGTEIPGQTEPSVQESTGQESADGVLAGGNWSGEWIRWQLDESGTLVISGSYFTPGQEPYPWAQYRDKVRRIIVADGVNSVPDSAFANMYRVTEVYLGNSVEVLGYGAFENCSALSAIVIPANVGWIGAKAFMGCTGLESVQFSAEGDLTEIHAYAFANSGIRQFTAPANLRSIQTGAFSGCWALQTAILTGSVEEVGSGAFANCTSLGHIALGSRITGLEDPFTGCNAIHTAELYNKDLYSFQNAAALKTVVIGGSAKEIGEFNFYGCSALSSVAIHSQVERIGQYAFANCGSLTAFVIPEGLKRLESGVFGNTGLAQITIPGSVEEIYAGAFGGAPLTQVEFLGSVPKMIASTAFSGVTAAAYYPTNDPSWSEEFLLNYGGSLTWSRK